MSHVVESDWLNLIGEHDDDDEDNHNDNKEDEHDGNDYNNKQRRQ